jgi:ketosteroid isomerase-like protein
MRLLSLAPALVLFATGPVHAQSVDPALAARDSSWNVLRLRGDADGLAALLADDWLLTHSDGRTQDKRDYLAELTRGARGGRVNTEITNADVRVRRYGDAAVVTGASVQSGIGADGAPFSGRFRFTRVWVRRNGVWVMVASHSSREATAEKTPWDS